MLPGSALAAFTMVTPPIQKALASLSEHEVARSCTNLHNFTETHGGIQIAS